ncbi:CCZ1 [Candida pseudojiufengensis]|uniref:CCZ1 n=1 Tax=Candida pseudojiufengensis TaxID=497109 RepID=UPI0022248005|nr:CCZ1 [Candida pseudojiufengensis]KAI5963226.1 CCZ1 [Candida pseudojiufengensis]
MASYITQYFPHISSLSLSSTDDINQDSYNPLEYNKVNYIIIVDSSNDLKSEENDPTKDIIAYAQNEVTEDNLDKRKNSIGIIKGILAFIKGFSSHKAQEQPMILKLSNESIVVLQLESLYLLVCSVNTKDDRVIKQLQFLIKQQHCFFKLSNKSIQENEIKLGKDISNKLLVEWWTKFIKSYNSQELLIDIGWPNHLNYLGFISIYMPGINHRNSSITTSNRLKEDIKKTLRSEDLVPSGVLINCFSKVPKKLGYIYSQVLDDSIENESIIDVYNLMEYEFIFKEQNEDLNASNLDEIDETSGPLSILNPMNLTNSLVVQPWNSVSGIIRRESQETSTDDNQTTAGSGWLSMPNFFGKSNDYKPVIQTPQEEMNNGQFLYGIQTDQTIKRKIVYLPTKIDDIIKNEEYQLITFVKDEIYITLIYSSSFINQLDDPIFYSNLLPTLNSIYEDIEQESLNSTLSKSINSIKTINISSKIDSEFLYTIFNLKNKSFTSSLPLIINSNKSKNHQIIINIHNQIIEILNNLNFLSSINEFYHKFKSNQNNDWIFYLIKYNFKIIIIIKNKNRYNNHNNHNNDKDDASVIEESVLNQITGFVSDYASLGFLDNLGSDVKYWLGQVIETEE